MMSLLTKRIRFSDSRVRICRDFFLTFQDNFLLGFSVCLWKHSVRVKYPEFPGHFCGISTRILAVITGLNSLFNFSNHFLHPRFLYSLFFCFVWFGFVFRCFQISIFFSEFVGIFPSFGRVGLDFSGRVTSRKE